MKKIDFSPSEFLDEHLRKRGSSSIEDRRWAVSLVTEFCRDSSDSRNRSAGMKRLMFTAVKQLFDYYEIPLTSQKNVLGEKMRLKHKNKGISVDLAKKILAVLNQRDKTICLSMAQSGMSIGDVLRKFNFMLDYVKREIALGKERIRINFDERKRNDFPYYTFISRDSIQELRKWLVTREEILQKHKPSKQAEKAIFITNKGTLLTVGKFDERFCRQVERSKLKHGAYSIRSHQFRDLFKTESRLPDRGIDGDYIEFMMGHSNGIDNNKLKAVGGIYDKSPTIHEDVVEKEYEKLEPYINIYSGQAALVNAESKQIVQENEMLRERLDRLQPLVEFANSFEGKEKLQEFMEILQGEFVLHSLQGKGHLHRIELDPDVIKIYEEAAQKEGKSVELLIQDAVKEKSSEKKL